MNRLALMVLRNIAKVPGVYSKLCRYAKNPEKYPEAERYAHIQHIMKLAVASGNVNLKVYGKENIPKENGFLIYPNHQGLFDVVAIVSEMDVPMGGVYKKELMGIPVVKEIAASTYSFAMDREDARQGMEVIKNVTAEVMAGRNYLIFPEGTRSRNGNKLMEFHGGSFRCAVKAKCPILPIAVIDTHKAFDQKGSKPITCQVHFLKPIQYEEYAGMKANAVADLVKSRIQATIDEYEEK